MVLTRQWSKQIKYVVFLDLDPNGLDPKNKIRYIHLDYSFRENCRELWILFL